MARILCVDDEPHVATQQCSLLAAAGHDVTASASAHDAVEKIRQHPFDLVVTEWRLNGADAGGRAVLEAARAHSSAPVVIVSASLDDALQAQPRADLYLEKPVPPHILLTGLDELLKRHPKPTTDV